jgi:transcriptional regulator with XRE-family HTH domain
MTQDSPGGSPQSAPVVSLEDLGELIHQKRRADDLTLEEAAQQSGVSAATLSRWERQGQNRQGTPGTEQSIRVPDIKTLNAISRWLRVSVRTFEPSAPAHSVVHHVGEDTPDIVEAHLRADRKLDPETAGVLGRMFRVAYEQFAKLQPAAPTEDRPERNTDNGPYDPTKTD